MNWFVDLLNLLIIVGIGFDVYAAMEIRGAMLQKIRLKILIPICLLLALIQCIFFFGGYIITYEMVQHNEVQDANTLGFGLAAIIDFLLAVRLIHKAIKREQIEEKREEMSVKNYVLIMLAGAIYTLFAGLASGLMAANIWLVMFFIVASTVVVVSMGIYTGYRYGFASRPRLYVIGAVLLIIAGLASLLSAFL